MRTVPRARARTVVALAAACSALLLLPSAAIADEATRCDAGGDAACKTHRYGSAIDWIGEPEAAAEAAGRQRKLLAVLQLAGEFPDPGRT